MLKNEVPEVCETCDYQEEGWDSVGCAQCTQNKNHINRWKKHKAIVAAEKLQKE